jgi:hypothetical protein
MSLLKTTLDPEMAAGVPVEPSSPFNDAMKLKVEADGEPTPIHVKFLQPPDSPEDLTNCTIENLLPPPPGFPVLLPEELLKNYWSVPPKKRATARMHTGPLATTPDKGLASQIKIKKLDADVINNDPKLNMTAQVELVRLNHMDALSDDLDKQRRENYNMLKRATQAMSPTAMQNANLTE